MKSNAQYFPVVLFFTLYKVVLALESVGEILRCQTIDFPVAIIIILIEASNLRVGG